MSNNTAVVPTASRRGAEHWSNKDPAEWPTRAASRVVVAHDYGVSNDHSTIVAAGLWQLEGGR